jgi:hypothetical protein
MFVFTHALLLHLTTNACSNGINWLYPLRNSIVGGPLIPYPLWIWSDLLILVPATALLIHRLDHRAADSVALA